VFLINLGKSTGGGGGFTRIFSKREMVQERGKRKWVRHFGKKTHLHGHISGKKARSWRVVVTGRRGERCTTTKRAQRDGVEERVMGHSEGFAR